MFNLIDALNDWIIFRRIVATRSNHKLRFRMILREKISGRDTCCASMTVQFILLFNLVPSQINFFLSIPNQFCRQFWQKEPAIMITWREQTRENIILSEREQENTLKLNKASNESKFNFF